jgi:hypothetical protein
MSKLIDCLNKTTHTKNGIPISGHSFVAELAIYDKDTSRMYAVLKCSNCKRHSVSFADNQEFMPDDGRYGPVHTVGGSDE